MIKIVGIHARSHDNHERFIGNIDLFAKQLKLYLTRDKFKGMYLISLATDSSHYEKKIKKVYKNRVMTVNNVTRKADADQLSSITDFIFLMFSDRLIGSYHSTYSSMVAIMSGITLIVYGNDWKCFVKYSNSQVGLLYFLYQNKQEYCPLVNMKIRLYSKDEQMIRAYFRYLIL